MLTKKIRVNDKSIHPISAGIYVITLTIMSILNAQAATSDVTYGDARIDAPVTSKNSVLVDFGHGGFLRIPKMLFAPGWNLPKDPDTPFKMGQISFVFQYPDMVLADYPSEMDLVFQKGEGGHYIHKSIQTNPSQQKSTTMPKVALRNVEITKRKQYRKIL